MRFKSEAAGGYVVYAVTGTNTVSFAIDAAVADTKGLLGFAVERFDPTENQRYFLYGFKVFETVIPHPDEDTRVTTFDHPVQAFVYDDFTAKPGRAYQYSFFPLRGEPKNLDRSAPPVVVGVRTEQLYTSDQHDVFFNRGVASSQAYRREFGNRRPDALPDAQKTKALQWLSRDLDDALLAFIAQAGEGDTLLCCFYEFRYEPVAKALAAAAARKVALRLIVDAKHNETTDKKTGGLVPAFPRTDNIAMIGQAGIPKEAVIRREARPNDIQHNKFIVLLRQGQAEEVWTGSTNMSVGGIHGQTNVGHWLRNKDVAGRFHDYWQVLSADPGGQGSRSAADRKEFAAFRTAVEAIVPVPAGIDDIPVGTSAIFSPRSSLAMLDLYAELMDGAKDLSCVTLAFGIGEAIKQRFLDNDAGDHLAFFLLEKRDMPSPRSKKLFQRLNARNNVYMAWGAYLRNSLYQWARETYAGALKLNQHVSYIHSKFLLRDPLGDDPIVVTGSANFSAASTTSNDENMLIIRGDKRCADIYFTEFNRLFFHYYFRSVQEAAKDRAVSMSAPGGGGFSPFLAPDDRWVSKYARGGLRWKRVQAFVAMRGFAQAP